MCTCCGEPFEELSWGELADHSSWKSGVGEIVWEELLGRAFRQLRQLSLDVLRDSGKTDLRRHVLLEPLAPYCSASSVRPMRIGEEVI